MPRSAVSRAGITINLGNFLYGSATSHSFAEAAGNTSGTLTITNGGALTVNFKLLGNYTSTDFALSADAGSGTNVKFA